MAGAELKHLTKRFKTEEVLKGISLTIPPCSFTVLLGPSGCGKSTTLRLLAGLERRSSGEIRIGDRDVSDLEPRERDVAMVFQNYALYPTMTIAGNMGFGLKARKMPPAEIRRRVDHAAQMLGISHLLGRKPGQLSGGQQQRVAIGRAIVRQPALFLFDEPLSNLDAKLRVEMRAELLRLHRRLEATTVFVTHDQEEAMTMADQIVVMNEGGIEQIGTPVEIYFTPASLMVARFVGSPTMNVMEAQLVRGRLETQLGSLKAPAGLDTSTSLTVGVRPDDLVPSGTLRPEDTAGCARFQVELVELLGARGIVTLTANSSTFKAVMEERQLRTLAPGATLDLEFSVESLHLFDEAGGRLSAATDKTRGAQDAI